MDGQLDHQMEIRDFTTSGNSDPSFPHSTPSRLGASGILSAWPLPHDCWKPSPTPLLSTLTHLSLFLLNMSFLVYGEIV